MRKTYRPVFYYGENSLPELEDEYLRNFELSFLYEMSRYRDILREADDLEGAERDVNCSPTWNYF